MIRFEFSARDRRALIVLAALVAPLAAWRAILAPWLELRSALHDRIAHEARLLERERLDLSRADHLRVALDSAREQVARQENTVFRGNSRALAEAAAAEHARTLAELSGVMLSSVDTPGGDTIADGIASTRLAVTGQADLPGFLLFLRRIEAGPGRIVTRGIAIRTARRTEDTAGPALSFELALDAHYRIVGETAPVLRPDGEGGTR
jgi:hypothetical protein